MGQEKFDTIRIKGKYSFWSLLCACKITIPIIQRDYAHGRNTEQARQVRVTLVNRIIRAALAKEKRRPLSLQYVYGNVNKEGRFVPVDGQQRLTTLFLLHLFLIEMAFASKNTESFCRSVLKRVLGRFSYETRATSDDFCKALIGHDLSAGVSIQPKDEDELEHVSRWIKDQNWFMDAWRRDPTVDGMLRTLDTIHELFWNQCSSRGEAVSTAGALLRPLLIGKEGNFLVSFDVLDMRQAGLSDDLYLKMNARGLPLTPLENLKSAIEKFYKSSKLAKEFSRKMDGAWLDAVWHCEENQKDVVSSADGSMLVLLMRFCVFSAAIHNRIVTKQEADKLNAYKKSLESLLEKKNRSSEKIDALRKKISAIELRNNLEERVIPISRTERFVSFSILECFLNDDNRDKVLREVSGWFDRFSQFRVLMLSGLVPYWKEYSESDSEMSWHSFLTKFKDGSPAWKEMSVLFAALSYFEYGSAADEYKRWMHFAWNLIENSGIDQFDRFVAFVRVINFHACQICATKSSGIYAYLHGVTCYFEKEEVESVQNLVVSDLAAIGLRSQFAEEVVKAKLRADKTSATAESDIDDLEKLPWLKGRIRIVFSDDGNVNSDLSTALSVLGDGAKRKKWLYSIICAKENEYQKDHSWVYPIYISSIMTKNRVSGDPALKAFLYDGHYIELIRRETLGKTTGRNESTWLTRIGGEQWTAIREIRSYQPTGGVYAYTTSDIRGSYRIDDGIKWWYDFVGELRAEKFNWKTQDQGGWVWCRIGSDELALCQYEQPFVQILSKGEWLPTVAEAKAKEREWISVGDFRSLVDMLRSLKHGN